jgi:hypothetical protein
VSPPPPPPRPSILYHYTRCPHSSPPSTSSPSVPDEHACSTVCLFEPTTYRDIVAYHEWQFAKTGEIAALEHNDTWELIPRPHFVVPITCKWVYKIKTHSDSSIERFKACLVAHGFQQQYDHDYEGTFAHVAHRTAVHNFIAVTSVRRWTLSASREEHFSSR